MTRTRGARGEGSAWGWVGALAVGACLRWNDIHVTRAYWVAVTELGRLKAAGVFVFDPSLATGVVTFPSFHALLAGLAGYALAPIRGVGPLAVLVAGAIVLSTVATGWHYTTDVVGGLGLLAAAWGIAGRLCVPDDPESLARRVHFRLAGPPLKHVR